MTHHQTTADLITAARSITPNLRRVHAALLVIRSDEHLSALLNAPPTLQRGLLTHALTLRTHDDPEGLQRILETTFSMPDLLGSLRTQTPTLPPPMPTPEPVPAASPPTPPTPALPAAHAPAPTPPTPPTPTPPTPTPPTPTVSTPSFAEEQTELRRLNDWDFPELSRYLLNAAQIDVHPKTLKALKQGTQRAALPSDILPALRAVPTSVTYTDPDDPRNPESVHFETFYDLHTQIKQLSASRTGDVIAAHIRASTGLNSLTRTTIDQLLRAHFADGRHWIIELNHLSSVSAALTQLAQTASTTTDNGADPDPGPASEAITSYRERMHALEEAFGQNVFTTKQASELLNISTKDSHTFLQGVVQKLRCEDLPGRRWRLT